MKNGWDVKKLGEVCTLRSGITLPKSLEKPIGEIPYLKVADMNLYDNQNGANTSSRFVDIPDVNQNSLFPKGTTIFPKRGGAIYTNKKRLTKLPICADSNIMGVMPSDKLLPEFLFNYFLALDLRKIGSGSSIPQINNYDIEPLLIAFPKSIEEQQRIVAILDESFAAIAKAKENTEKNLQNVREFFENYKQSIFIKRDEGWIEKPLGELAAFRNGINFTKTSRGDSAKIVGVKDFQKNFWVPLDNLDTVTMDGRLPEADKLKENDILFVRSNGNMELIGRCLLVGKVTDKITYSGFTIRARLHGDSVMPKYLCHFLKSNNARRKMIDSGIGTNIKSLNQPTLSALVIPFPSISEQSRLVDQLEAIEVETQRLEAIYQQKLAALEELKQSILQKAFSGELTASGELTVSDEPTASSELSVPRIIQQEMLWA